MRPAVVPRALVAFGTPTQRPWGASGDQEIAETITFLMPDGAAYSTGRHHTVADGSGLASATVWPSVAGRRLPLTSRALPSHRTLRGGFR